MKQNNIRVFILPGFEIARKATNKPELQLRMQGNSFLGAFFRVSPFFLAEYGITEEKFQESVRKQYQKKFGRFGDHVVESNMTEMIEGFSRVVEIHYGKLEDADRSSMRNPLMPPVEAPAMLATAGCGSVTTGLAMPGTQPARAPVQTLAKFNSEFRAGYGYHQPSSAFASVGVVAAGSGCHAVRKYVARRETPVYIAENCHAVHGVHHRVPGHRIAKHGAKRRCYFAHRRDALRQRCGRAQKVAGRTEEHQGSRSCEDERGREGGEQDAIQRHHS